MSYIVDTCYTQDKYRRSQTSKYKNQYQTENKDTNSTKNTIEFEKQPAKTNKRKKLTEKWATHSF